MAELLLLHLDRFLREDCIYLSKATCMSLHHGYSHKEDIYCHFCPQQPIKSLYFFSSSSTTYKCVCQNVRNFSFPFVKLLTCSVFNLCLIKKFHIEYSRDKILDIDRGISDFCICFCLIRCVYTIWWSDLIIM